MNDLGFDDDFMATMLGDFLDESQGYLTRLNENLLVLDELVEPLDENETLHVDLELLNEMFRDAHSLKKLSAMLQLDDINNLTHRIENVFDAARRDNLCVTRDVTDLMFQAVDRLAGMVERLKDPDAQEIEFHSVIEEIRQLLEKTRTEQAPAIIANTNQPNSDSEGDAPVRSGLDAVTPVEKVAPSMLESPTSNPKPVELAETEDPFADVSDETEISDKYLSIFIDETEQSLDVLADALIDDGLLEVDSLLAIGHRIKGAAAAVGFHRAAKLAHGMEDLLQDVRECGGHVTSEIADALLSAVDTLRSFVQTLKTGTGDSSSFSQAYHTLNTARSSAIHSPEARGALHGNDDNSKTSSAVATPHCFDETRQRVAAEAPSDCRTLAGMITFIADLPLVELKASMICDRLSEMGELIYTDPPEQQLEETSGLSSLVFGLVTNLEPDELRRHVEFDGVERVDIEVVSDPVTQPTTQPTADTLTPVSAPTSAAPRAASTPSPTAQHAAPPGPNPSPASPDAARGRNAGSIAKDKPAETLRVDIERLDQLMNLAGQLVINKARFAQITDELKGVASRKQSALCLANVAATLDRILSDADLAHDATEESYFAQSVRSHVQHIKSDLEVVASDISQLTRTRTTVNDLSEAVHQLDRVSDGIQKSVMDTRMVPVGPLFGRFKRVVRDVTRGNGKEVRLVIRGEKTELDKRMIDELGDPLIHIVRNAADHGVETPAERQALGKPKQGTVTLDAFHRGNRVFIQVRDDGKGLDPEKIRTKAIAKGIISSQDAERLTPQQTYQLIWEPGFSTAEKITEVSGRGMGMDIVRSKIEQLSGTVELDSQVGEGTSITIKLPLTMAILPSLLTVISGDVFAIPVESVVEIVRVTANDLATVHGLTTARVRGRVISVVELTELFHWNKTVERHCRPNGERTLVIIGTDGDELGMAVDDLLGEEDIVIKSLAENYRNVHGLAGASILGDGRVSLILDVAALIGMTCRKSATTAGDTTEVAGSEMTLTANSENSSPGQTHVAR